MTLVTGSHDSVLYISQTSSEGGRIEGEMDLASLPVADHEQDGYVMVNLTDIVSHIHSHSLALLRPCRVDYIAQCNKENIQLNIIISRPFSL